MNGRHDAIQSRAVAVLLLTTWVLASSTQAQERVVGYTSGCFGDRCTVPDSAGELQTATLGGLIFTNARIVAPLAGLPLVLDGPATLPGAQSTNNLGSFFLATDLFNYTGRHFSLRITLVPPFDPGGNRSAVIRATLGGIITNEEGSPNSVTIKFDRVPVRLTGGYMVTVSLKDITLIANGEEQRIVATIERRGP